MVGIEGQGISSNPASFFTQHFIVEIAGKKYDPSYGIEYSSLDDLDAKMGGFLKFDFHFWDPDRILFQKNSIGLDLISDILDF